MSELGKTDVKFLGMIEPHIEKLQVFLDANIVSGKTMTASAIYQAYKPNTVDAIPSSWSEEDFIRAFRLALREGKLTGIEGAQRAGYKRIGTENVKSVPLVPYMERIQKFVSANIKGQVRMTAAMIYELFTKEYGCSLTEDVFVQAFRVAIRDNTITGLESAQKFGYRASTAAYQLRMAQSTSETIELGDSTEESEPEVLVAEGGVGLITIDDTHRLVSSDSRNWSYQIRKDSGMWMTEAYFGNHVNIIQGFARRLLDQELRVLDGFNFKELEQKFTQAENRISELLRKAMNPGKEVE